MVKIFIVDLNVTCLVGIYPEERIKTKLVFNIEINSSINFLKTTFLTIDYSKIENDIVLL